MFKLVHFLLLPLVSISADNTATICDSPNRSDLDDDVGLYFAIYGNNDAVPSSAKVIDIDIFFSMTIPHWSGSDPDGHIDALQLSYGDDSNMYSVELISSWYPDYVNNDANPWPHNCTSYNFTFDDSADTVLFSYWNLFGSDDCTMIRRPQSGVLSYFNGFQASGRWILYLQGEWGSWYDTFNQWCVIITYDNSDTIDTSDSDDTSDSGASIDTVDSTNINCTVICTDCSDCGSSGSSGSSDESTTGSSASSSTKTDGNGSDNSTIISLLVVIVIILILIVVIMILFGLYFYKVNRCNVTEKNAASNAM